MKLILKNITKNFGEKKVLNNASFEFEQGKIYGLLGRNGAGKTTLFNVLNEDLELDDGTFELVDNSSPSKLTNEDIGYVLSTPVVPDFLTAREFIKFFIDINQNPSNRSIDDYFDYMQIQPDDRDRLLKDFSHGMKNKMQMLINFIANPMIFLLDEPLTSLDVVVAEQIKKLFMDIKKDHIIIFSTHIMELALSICDEIVILNDGALSGVEGDKLNNEDFKEKIIAILKGDENV